MSDDFRILWIKNVVCKAFLIEEKVFDSFLEVDQRYGETILYEFLTTTDINNTILLFYTSEKEEEIEIQEDKIEKPKLQFPQMKELQMEVSEIENDEQNEESDISNLMMSEEESIESNVEEKEVIMKSITKKIIMHKILHVQKLLVPEEKCSNYLYLMKTNNEFIPNPSSWEEACQKMPKQFDISVVTSNSLLMLSQLLQQVSNFKYIIIYIRQGQTVTVSYNECGLSQIIEITEEITRLTICLH
ncbi:uncharacterized protein [Centruroides vittatus]|uniref:uncharacterized protein n=1 Tax=Centruroides vittatus TaxID=120091 RepID=UPI00350F6AFC